MAKSQNPVDLFRREQKKKDLKKHKLERQKAKQARLASLDPEEIKQKISKIERHIQLEPEVSSNKKRKKELEESLTIASKRCKAKQDDKKQLPKTIKDLDAANKAKYQCPENSVYYHPVLNPYGAPPPGHPQMYQNGPAHDLPPPPRPRTTPASHSFRDRPGKRPPLPPVPPPPNVIQVPLKPPLPEGPIPYKAPPPPPIPKEILNKPSTKRIENLAPIQATANDPLSFETGVVAVYPPNELDTTATADSTAMDSSFPVSLIPTALRVRRIPKVQPPPPTVPHPVSNSMNEEYKALMRELHTLEQTSKTL